MGERLTKLILLAIMLLALAPFGSPDVKLDNLGDLNVDVAFQLALPYFLEQRLQFGEQVVFTYGPWGILMSAFTGATWHVAALLFRIALVVGVFLALCVLADRYSDRNSRIVTWGGAIALVLLWITGHRDSYFLFPALLVAYQRLAVAIVADGDAALPTRRAEHLFWIALSLMSGWAALAKFNIFAVSTVAYLLILADDVNRRRWPVLPFSFATAVLIAWLGAGQSLANLPLWVLRCLDLSNGYADAMSKGFFIPYGAGQVAVYYGAVALIILTAFAAAALHRWKLPALLSLLFTLFLCAVAIKHGIGGNQLEQSLALLAAVLWFVSQLLVIPKAQGGEQDMPLWGRFGLATALTAVLFMVMVAAGVNFPIRSPKDALADMRSNASLLVRVLRGNSTDRWDEMLAKAHRFWQPVNVSSSQTIDVYPQHTGVVIGREGLRYSPRPAFLSLNAHTFTLAMLNAGHLEESTAPDLILFQVLPRERSVNNRHPALADGPSWPLLLSRYAPENAGDEFLLLKKRPQPLRIERKILLDANLQLGELVVLPPQSVGDLLWAEVEISRSPVGNIIHTFYKSPHVLLESRIEGNKKHVFQIVPELGKAGFLISPLVESNEAFTKLYSREEGSIVKSIAFSSSEAPETFWKKTIALKIFSLRINAKI
ncbi:MAG: hypothetical protein H7240_11045 [Glaciimonas sp.]|nr:hypothetical protein [Glaciimonas sp.]